MNGINGIEVRNGGLYFDGNDLVGLAKYYGTPLYVMSETIIRDRCRMIKSEFTDKYPDVAAVFASKAFQTLDMCRIVQSEGLGMDVVSGGELYCALKAGFPPERLVFHGNSKTVAEMEYAVESGVGRIVADSLYEIHALERIAAARNETVRVLYRVTPGVDSHTHRFISTGGLDSKFGIPLDRSVRDLYMRAVLDSPHLDFMGFHFHVGSQISKNISHLAALGIVLDLIADTKRDYGVETRELNLGGGFAVRYLPDDPDPGVTHFVAPMMEKIKRFCADTGMAMPRVTIEPGRWIVGEAGLTLYTIGSIKEIPGIRTYVGVDGGMPDNIRPALYDAKYFAAIANKAELPPADIVTIAGKCCESGDILIRDIALPKPESGDILSVFSTGAYNHSMASNYNRLPRPAVVMVREGTHRLSVRRESYEDLLSREL